jgi:Flp pilus assembly protein TadG
VTERDPGSSTLTTVLLTPLLVVLAFAAFQAAMWSHARTEARAVARDTAALVARRGVAIDDARSSALAVLAADTDLRDVAVEIAVRPVGSTSTVVVGVRGRAPGILRGTRAPIAVQAAVPVEGWTP